MKGWPWKGITIPEEKQYYPSTTRLVHTSTLRDGQSYLLLSRVRFPALISLPGIYLIFFASTVISPFPTLFASNLSDVSETSLEFNAVCTARFEEMEDGKLQVINLILFSGISPGNVN